MDKPGQHYICKYEQQLPFLPLKINNTEAEARQVQILGPGYQRCFEQIFIDTSRWVPLNN